MTAAQDLLNKLAPIIFMQGEETAGIAGDLLRQEILDELGIAYEAYDMSVAGRITSGKGNIGRAIDAVLNSQFATLVKEPGITPSPLQMIDSVVELVQKNELVFEGGVLDAAQQAKLAELKQQHLKSNPPTEHEIAAFVYELVGSKRAIDYVVPSERGAEEQNPISFAKRDGVVDIYGSPNAIWRNALKVNLIRGASDLVRENLTPLEETWSKDTPIQVIVRPEGDTIDYSTLNSGQYTVQFVGQDGEVKKIGEMNIEGDATPLRVYTDSEDAVTQWATEQLGKLPPNSQIIQGTKQTVINTDYALINWLNKVIDALGINNQVYNDSGLWAVQNTDGKKNLSPKPLVDNVHGALAANAPKDYPLAIIAPNPTYADYVRLLEVIKDKGGFKSPTGKSCILRASATKDHYLRHEYRPEQAGEFQILDANGNVVSSKQMQANDVVIATNFDRARVATMVKQSLDYAIDEGLEQILFGFDPNDPYYQVADEELQKLLVQPQYASLADKIVKDNPVELTARYFTQGLENTLLVLGNIHGDFATDIELAGKGTSYSIGIMEDGRKVVETGALGTAPDLLDFWKADGLQYYNPMAFIEAYSQALTGVAKNLTAQGNQQEAEIMQATATALESAVYQTTQKGLLLPISVIEGRLIQTDNNKPQKVSLHTFVAHVKLETFKSLEGTHPAATSEKIAQIEEAFKQSLAHDKAVFAVLDDASKKPQWQAANNTINTMLEKAGQIDPNKPDYNIRLPQNMDKAKITPEQLFNLRIAQAKEFL